MVTMGVIDVLVAIATTVAVGVLAAVAIKAIRKNGGDPPRCV